VVVCDDHTEVFVGGSLVGDFRRGDRATRDALLVCLSREPKVRFGRLADAFGVSKEMLRQVRRRYEAEGLEAVINRRRPGAERKLTPKLRERIKKMFDEGLTIDAAHEKACRWKKKVSRALIGRVHLEWTQRRHSAQGAGAQATTDNERAAEISSEVEPQDNGAEKDSSPKIVPTSVRTTRAMQHAGVWLLFGLLASWGIYERAQQAVSPGRRLASSALQIALDAVIAALAIGQRCVEGVRRVATPTAGLLLRTRRCPSAPWVRSTLGRAAADGGGFRFHIEVAGHFVAEAMAKTSIQRPVVFYVDNHLRPYTGKHVIRKGWRMQDRRARSGCSDYYVHDEDGRPVMRIDVPEHGSLPQWLPLLAEALREALGPDERILVAFDRGGAHANHLVELRDADFEFVTYERKPYRALRIGAFDQEFTDGEGEEAEQILACDKHANLGKGRGRVRRVALLMETGEQVNLLAVSKLDAKSLYRIARGRWRQENGFKHGNERWGINQLDGRTTEPVSPDLVIPNPARRRLDRAVQVARQHEGKLRCDLSQLARHAPKRERTKEKLHDAVQRRQDLELLRPHTPRHAPLKETELAGKLVRHPGEYKMWLDTIRVACANAESELAARLALHLPRAAEAKKVLANLFEAAGDVSISRGQISVTLRPAGTTREHEALRELLRQCSAMNLRLPGDTDGRTLAFRLPD
jgi:transposase